LATARGAPLNANVIRQQRRGTVLRTVLFIAAISHSASGFADCNQFDSLVVLRAKGVELSVPLTIEQLEREHMVPVIIGNQKVVLPFGHSNKQWLALKSKWQPGDYFVRYQSSLALARKNKVYTDGHLLVRGDCAIGSIAGAIS
jgi:hypothetical protein